MIHLDYDANSERLFNKTTSEEIAEVTATCSYPPREKSQEPYGSITIKSLKNSDGFETYEWKGTPKVTILKADLEKVLSIEPIATGSFMVSDVQVYIREK